MVRYGDTSEDVREVQIALKQLAQHMQKPSLDPGPVDSVLGPKTRQALNLWFAAAGIAHKPNEWPTRDLKVAADCMGGVDAEPRELPLLCAWYDRSGILSHRRCISLAEGVVDEVALFLHGTKERDYELLKGLTHIKNVSMHYRDAGLGVHWTVWNRPFTRAGKKNFRELVAAAASQGIGLDFDREFAAKGWKQSDTDFMCEALRGCGVVVGINDYASMQHSTGQLIKALAAHGVDVEARPQAYSVDHTTWGGHKLTQPDSVYWPGATQKYAMSERRWGALSDVSGVSLGMGLAIYKQHWSGRPMDAEKSVKTQVEAALGYEPRRLLFWDGERLQPGASVRKALLGLKGVG